MSNSYGVQSGEHQKHAFGLYDTINGEWVGIWFESRGEAEANLDSEDWNDEDFANIHVIVSTTDEDDIIM